MKKILYLSTVAILGSFFTTNACFSQYNGNNYGGGATGDAAPHTNTSFSEFTGAYGGAPAFAGTAYDQLPINQDNYANNGNQIVNNIAQQRTITVPNASGTSPVTGFLTGQQSPSQAGLQSTTTALQAGNGTYTFTQLKEGRPDQTAHGRMTYGFGSSNSISPTSPYPGLPATSTGPVFLNSIDLHPLPND